MDIHLSHDNHYGFVSFGIGKGISEVSICDSVPCKRVDQLVYGHGGGFCVSGFVKRVVF